MNESNLVYDEQKLTKLLNETWFNLESKTNFYNYDQFQMESICFDEVITPIDIIKPSKWISYFDNFYSI